MTGADTAYPTNNNSSFTLTLGPEFTWYNKNNNLPNCGCDFSWLSFMYKLDTDTLNDGGMVEVSHLIP